MNVERDWLFRTIVLSMVAAMITALFFDGMSHRGTAASSTQGATLVTKAVSAVGANTYKPQTREFVVTTVPLLVHEMTSTYDYLKQDFTPKGMLASKEVWAFSPSSFTVYAGDTVHVLVVNPSGDDHTFTLPSVGFNLLVKAQSTASGTFVVPAVGALTFVCTIAEHSPYMSGQLIVLPDSAAPQG
jgi:plastocyanin